MAKSKEKNKKEDSNAKKTTKKESSGVENDVVRTRAEKIKFCIGLVLILFGAIMLLSFISYFFTWKGDQSIVGMRFFSVLADPEIHVNNWVGKIGATIANLFMRNCFGVASLAIVGMMIAVGLKLLKFGHIRIWSFIIKSTIIMIWISIALASIFRDSFFFVGGAHGYFIFQRMVDFIGTPGTYATIVVLALIISIFCFEKALDYIKMAITKLTNLKFKDIKDKLETPADSIEAQEPTVTDPNILPLSTPDEFEGVEPIIDDEGAHVVHFGNDDEPEPPKQTETPNHDLEIINSQQEEEIQQEAEPTEEPMEEPEPAEAEPEAADDNPDGDISLQINEKVEEKTVNPEDWEHLEDYDPTKDLEFFKFPTIDLLPEFQPKNQISEEDFKKQLNENKEKIVQTLNDYDIKISKISATVGPTVTLYEIVPAPGVRISKIKNLEDDIALSLAALGIRIIAPIPGRGTIGIEVPNPNPETVSMNSVIRSKVFQESKYDLPVALGKTISNETYVFNLAKTPHLLVAGATGQGKSVGINAIIASLLYKKHPSQLKFVLVDPKMVELSIYKKIEKHYLAKLPGDCPSIITDVSKVTEAMNSLCILMDQRYELLTKAGCRNIKEYNEKFVKRQLNPENGHYYMFYIVVVIDEFADIIVQEGRQVETPISRLAAKARAIGIHLIVATQRPSTNVITGVIKANFPSRIAFKVTNYIDSKTILDQTGANQLIGRGDLLISYDGNITRVQCAFIDTPEVQKLVDYIGEQQGYPRVYELPEIPNEGQDGSGFGGGVSLDGSRDELFEEAARLICRTQQGSTSMLQRKFNIGYNRAGRIIDQLEAMGIVGPYEGSKARQVLYDETSLERYLETLS